MDEITVKSATNGSARNSLSINRDNRDNRITSPAPPRPKSTLIDKNDDLFSLDRQLNFIGNEPPQLENQKVDSTRSTERQQKKTDVLSMENQKLDSTNLAMLKFMITPEITKIDLMHNKLQGPDISELCKHIEVTSLKILTSLNLSSNNIGDDGANSLGYYIVESGCKLQSLTISYNNITDKGGVQLVSSLEENTSLKMLNLDCNLLTDLTLIEIERALMANPKCPLFNLSLADSRRAFTKTGAKVLWKLMSKRPALTITGDPPFTFTGNSQKTPKKQKKKDKNSEGPHYLFNEIAAESIQRMRLKSNGANDTV